MGTNISYPISKGPRQDNCRNFRCVAARSPQARGREGVTLRTLVERGLHRVVAESERAAPFKLRRASFKGKGRQVQLREASWEQLRDLVYKDRGA